jgi:hypothetical protein
MYCSTRAVVWHQVTSHAQRLIPPAAAAPCPLTVTVVLPFRHTLVSRSMVWHTLPAMRQSACQLLLGPAR